MQRSITRAIKYALPVLAVLFLLASAWYFAVGRQAAPQTGHLKITAVDAYTLAPIEGAVVLIPSTGISARSDVRGVAYLIDVPLSMAGGLEALPAREYGEATLLAYAEGYLPYALFYVHVYPGRMRSGPTIYLFPAGSEGALPATAVIESPDQAWVERLIAQYAP